MACTDTEPRSAAKIKSDELDWTGPPITFHLKKSSLSKITKLLNPTTHQTPSTSVYYVSITIFIYQDFKHGAGFPQGVHTCQKEFMVFLTLVMDLGGVINIVFQGKTEQGSQQEGLPKVYKQPLYLPFTIKAYVLVYFRHQFN